MNKMMRANIDRDKCTGCQACVEVCPVEAISIKNQKAYVNNTCIGCGACAGVCPVECIEIKLSDSEIEFS